MTNTNKIVGQHLKQKQQNLPNVIHTSLLRVTSVFPKTFMSGCQNSPWSFWISTFSQPLFLYLRNASNCVVQRRLLRHFPQTLPFGWSARICQTHLMWIGKLNGTWDLRTCGVNLKNKNKQYEKQLRQLWGASSLNGMFSTTSALRQLCVLSPRLLNVVMQWAVLGWKNATSERGLNLNDGSMYGLLKILCCLVELQTCSATVGFNGDSFGRHRSMTW